MRRQPPSVRGEPSGAAPYAALGAAAAALALFVRPWRLDFPLDDDWAYLLAAKRLAESGTLRLTDWAPSSQVFHVAWGSLWARLFGWNMGWLKVSTYLWFSAGAALLLALLLEEGVDASLALLGALTLLFNPIALVWSMSFMTDVPYLSLLIASCWAYARGLRTRRLDWLFAGSLAAAAATLVRQTGLFIPPAAALALWSGRRPRAGEGAAILAAPTAAYAAYAVWFRFAHGPTLVSQHYLAGAALERLAHPLRFASNGAFELAAGLSYLGLFLAPLLAARRWRAPTPMGAAFAAAFLAAAIALAIGKGAWPYLENTLERRGLGTLTLPASSYKLAGLLDSIWFWRGVTAAAAASGALFASVLPSMRPQAPRPAASFLAWTGILQFAASLLGAKYFDRYLLPLLPCSIALLCLSAGRSKGFPLLGFGLVGLLAAFSLAGEIDYAGWNAAKWELGRRAASAGEAPGRVEGGFDWDGWWTYEDAMAELKSRKPLGSIEEWEWRRPEGHDLFLTFHPDAGAGFERIDAAAYFSPLAMKEGRVYLYRLAGGR